MASGRVVWRADAESRVFSRLFGAWLVESELLRVVGKLVFFELAFFVAYQYGMSMPPQSGAPFWAPDSVLLCALLLLPPRLWVIFLAATLPVRLIGPTPPHMPSWLRLAAFANDALKAFVAATLLRKFLSGRTLRFDCLRDLWVYLGAAVALAPALSGLAGAASLAATGAAFWPAWRNWFFGDALANLVLTPLLLCLAVDWRKLLDAPPRRCLECGALFSLLFFAIQFAYQRGLNNPSILDLHDYIPVAFLLVAAVRFGPAGASGSLTMMSMLWIAALSTSPPASAEPEILTIQMFLMVIGVPIMSLSVLMEQQRKTELSLRESEQRFRNMADSAPVMIWIAGSDKLATFFNRGWLDFTGRSIGQELGYGWASGLHPEHRSACLAAYSAAFDERRLWHAECQLRRTDGEYRWLLCNGAPRFSEDGTFNGYIVSGSDITDLKSAQEASLARQKLESLGVLAGGIAHDFNNLLGGIYANAEIAETSEGYGSSPCEEIQNIKSISMRASGIVRQLMMYAGNEGSNVEPVDLSRLVEEMLGLIHLSVSKAAVLKTDLARDLPPLLGNGPQVQQVVMNLVLNASDALAGRDGTITVKTSLGKPLGKPAGRSSATNLGDSQYVRLEVSDTGCGISSEAQARIFDPFFTTKTAGRGLGLAVVQGVVRAHKGTIELNSTAGQGTTFRVFLPVAQQPAAKPIDIKSVPAAASSQRTSGTVLVVEDEQGLRLSIAKMLRREGLTVIDVGDGTEAVNQLRDRETKIDVVLLDMTIPGAPSSAVAAEAGRLRPGTRLLLTSAYSREMVGPLADSELVKGFIRKPFQLRELVGQIREAMSD